MSAKTPSACELCNVIFYTTKMKEDHLHGKRHLLAMHQANSLKVKEELGIFVTGVPNLVSHEEILALFETYGKVTSSFFGENNRFCIIQFDKPEPANRLIKLEGILFKGKNIKIFKRTVREREAAKAAYSSPMENSEEIISSLKNLPSFNTQLKWLIDQIQPGYHETRSKILALCNDLQSALTEEFRGCTIHTFGSTVTNLYLTNSDIDVYVEVFGSRNSPLKTTLSSVHVNRAKAILQKYGNVFTNLCAIPHAKTPIVKFVHVPTHFKCDFNFKNMLGVCNSRLIHYYLMLDHKLTPLMIFLKYWAKVHDLIGLGGKFSNYTLALMFIFYMQVSEYKLLSVATLQTTTTFEMHDGWNGGFQRSPSFSRTLRDHTMIKVLQGFFKFYSDFDYTLNVISPYLGRTIFKTDFSQINTLPSQFRLYKMNVSEGKLPLKVDSPICVQDPFELNHNVSVNVKLEYLEEFGSLCGIGVNILKDVSQDTMYKLFTEETDIFAKRCVLTDSECRFKVQLSSTLLQINDILKLKQAKSSEKETEIVREWQSQLKIAVFKILKDIMRFTITSDNEDKPEEKAQRLSGQKDIHHIISSLLHCCGYYNLWDGHKTIIKDITIDDSATLFDRQLAITKYILDVLYKGDILNDKIIQFDVHIKFTEMPAESILLLKNKNSRPGYFKQFASYFFKMFPLLFQSHLIEVIKLSRESEVLPKK